jgi:hypothetical protein
MRLGHAPCELLAEAPLALRTPSYHFQMRLPAGTYLVNSDVCVPALGVATDTGVLSHAALAQLSPRRGATFVEGSGPQRRNAVHIHLGDVHKVTGRAPRRLFIYVRLAERPLGHLAGATVRCLVVLATIATVRLVGARLINHTGNTAPVAILLALPAFLSISSYSAVDPQGTTVPVSARLASLIAGFAAVGAALSYLWWQALSVIHGAPSAGDHDGAAKVLGGLVVIVSLALVACAIGLLINVIRFARVSAPPSAAPLRVLR